MTTCMARIPRFGRTQDQVKVMPGFYPVVAPTASEAQEKYDYLQSLIQKPVGISILEHTIGVHGLDKLPLDGPVPEMADTNGPLSRQRLLLEQARRDKLTFWELCLANAGPRGHALSIGTPSQVADEMEHWFKDGAADGFNVMPAWLPGSLEGFRRSRHSRAAAPGTLPNGVRSHDPARESRPAQADQPPSPRPPRRSRPMSRIPTCSAAARSAVSPPAPLPPATLPRTASRRRCRRPSSAASRLPANLDPHQVYDVPMQGLMLNAYDNLYRYQNDPPQIVPWLAESHTVSADGLIWEFKLRPNVKFHDGSPLTAEDVVYSASAACWRWRWRRPAPSSRS